MKYSIANKKENVGLEDSFKDGIRKYDSKNLYDTITEAYKQNLIIQKQNEILLEMKGKFRNPYSHATSANVFGETLVKGAVFTRRKGEKGEDLINRIHQTETNQEFSIKDILPFHGIAQAMIVKEEIVPYFTTVDAIIRDMLNNLKPNSTLHNSK